MTNLISLDLLTTEGDGFLNFTATDQGALSWHIQGNGLPPESGSYPDLSMKQISQLQDLIVDAIHYYLEDAAPAEATEETS